MLKISELSVSVDNKLIIDNLNLEIPKGKKVVIMGPNGCGKSTLSNIISGKFGYNINNGSIKFEGIDISESTPDERAALGIYMAFQYPIEIPGIATSSFLRTAINSMRKKNNQDPVNTRKFLDELNDISNKLGLDKSFLSRDLNCGFSGGEKKKNEILQLLLLKPKFCVLDEIDSGLDIDSLKVISKGITEFSSSKNSILIITHYQRLLDYVQPDEVHIFNHGKIVRSGGTDLVRILEAKGYKEFV